MIVLCIMKESECGSYLKEIKLPLKVVVVIRLYILYPSGILKIKEFCKIVSVR